MADDDGELEQWKLSDDWGKYLDDATFNTDICIGDPDQVLWKNESTINPWTPSMFEAGLAKTMLSVDWAAYLLVALVIALSINSELHDIGACVIHAGSPPSLPPPRALPLARHPAPPLSLPPAFHTLLSLTQLW